MLFDYLKIFWAWVEQNPDKVKTFHIALYLAILHRANQSKWNPKLIIINSDYMALTAIHSPTSLIKTLNELEEFGFIKTEGRTPNQFHNRVISIPLNGTVVEREWNEDEMGVESSWKQLKTIKTNKTIKTKKTNKADLEKLYSENPQVNEAFIQFLKHRIEIKKPATQRAADMLFAELKKLCSNSTEAVELINHCIMNGWQGFYKPKQNGNKPTQQQQTFTRSSIAHYS